MKRILLSLAALAALASCVKENTLAPAADQLTISAVSADTKTTLDGLNVVWEKTDKIAVVVNANEKVTAEFDIVESTLDGSAADFVGTMEWAKGSATSAYAVYPAAAVELTHTLPAAQTGEVSGLMLSAAALEVEDMQKGAATAEFHPALSLLQVAVPAGVKSVELTSAGAALVGDATFEVNPATGAVALTVADDATKTVSISAEEELEAKTYPVVVYPGEVGDLTLKLVGAKGEEFVKTVSNITLAVAEARTINLMQIFQFAPEAIEVAPNGGSFEIPFTTTVEEVTVTENADWLESSVAVKGFQTGNVCLVAAANEGDETRTAEVKVSWGEGKSVSFTLTQPAIYRGFLNDADGNPIQWEETFGVYGSESDANAAANAYTTHENVFTIALSDDYTKGTYIVDNIFKATSYYNNGQPVSNKGGKFYANYKDGKLTLLYANSVNCYGFTSDVTISYDETAKTFSAPALKVYDYSVYRDRYIGGYAAVVKVEEAPGGNNELDKFVGTWSETYVNKPYSWSTETIYENEFTVSVVDGKLYFEGMFLYKMGSTEYRSNYYGTPSADGTTITLEDADSNSPHGYFGPMAYAGGPIVLTVDGNTLTVASAYNGAVANYVATKQGAVEPEPEPEPEVPAIDFAGLDWASAAVAVNDESATDDFKMKEIRAFGDDEYLYVRLATAQGLPLEADHLGLSFCDGAGSNEVWWGWTTTGTNTYYGQHMGEIDADGKLTGMSFGDADVICHTEVSGESVTWYLAFPRESVEQYVSAKGKIYVSALLWNAWSEFWAAPARGGAMLAVTLFEDPNSLKNVDWNADEVVSYDLPSDANSSRQSLRSVKYFADAENIKVRLVASAEKLAEEKEDDGVMTPTTHLGIFLYDVVNGSGNGYYSWWNGAAGNNEYEGEHVGVITGTDLSLSVNGVNVEVEKVVEGDDVVWMFAIPRSSHANLAANEVNMAFIAYRNWGQTGALPDKYDDMFKVTLP